MRQICMETLIFHKYTNQRDSIDCSSLLNVRPVANPSLLLCNVWHNPHGTLPAYTIPPSTVTSLFLEKQQLLFSYQRNKKDKTNGWPPHIHFALLHVTAVTI